MESREQQHALARELVLKYGWNSTAYQILNPGIDYWFAAGNAAVVGYTRRGHVLLVAGAPVSAPESLRSVCEAFEAFARAHGCRVCYVCADARIQGSGHATVAMGAQPVWDPRSWSQVASGNHSLRRQLNRARNKGVTIDSVAAADRDMREVLDEWLKGRTLPRLHFLVESEILGDSTNRTGESACPTPDRVILVARRNARTVAFLIASPIPARNGYLVELLARSRRAPNGTAELLIDTAMRRFAGEGRQYATLGLVALAHAADHEIRRNPAWLRTMMQFARAHANRFYNFRGLEHFRTKMTPQLWEPVYAISDEKRFSARTFYAMGAAFSGIPPWLAIGIGVVKAVRTELYCASQAIPRAWSWLRRWAMVDPTSVRKASRSGGL